MRNGRGTYHWIFRRVVPARGVAFSSLLGLLTLIGLTGLSVSGARASGATDVLLLSCMDHRLIGETARYMNGKGLQDKYDHIILDGAALGALTNKHPAWNQTFWEHLEIAIQLHGIHKVVVIDHRDCEAYKVVLGEDFAKDRVKETAAHATQLGHLGKLIAERMPRLEIELLLMSLDGKVETIPLTAVRDDTKSDSRTKAPFLHKP